jgi:16S rRNA (uracil1498-N3)-methyltransferase
LVIPPWPCLGQAAVCLCATGSHNAGCYSPLPVNLILFEPSEIARPLPRTDPRAQHLLDVLRRREGDSFDVGLVQGPRGKGTLVTVGVAALTLAFVWGEVPPPPPPVTLLLGLPRPQTARDVLRDATTIGVTALHFVATEKSERTYASSTLWTTGEWRRHVLAGAAQAFDPHLPEVTWGRPLAEMVAGLAPATVRLALDPYEATASLTTLLPPDAARPLVLALGPERGWGAADRALLRAHGFTLAHLGPRPLRVETAALATLAIAHAQRGFQ